MNRGREIYFPTQVCSNTTLPRVHHGMSIADCVQLKEDGGLYKEDGGLYNFTTLTPAENTTFPLVSSGQPLKTRGAPSGHCAEREKKMGLELGMGGTEAVRRWKVNNCSAGFVWCPRHIEVAATMIWIGG